MAIPFRHDHDRHVYTALDTGEQLQHITGMLARTGWIDDTWFTEEASERGSMVHELTAAFDLGALEVGTLDSPWRPYLLAHVRAIEAMGRPEMLAVEQPAVHPRYRYAGRPDRVVRLWGRLGVLEVKTGDEIAPTPQQPTTAHSLQTALQAMLVEHEYNMPADAFARWALYLKPTGKYKLREHKDRGDFNEALKVIRRCV
jgi:hypothetical protein